MKERIILGIDPGTTIMGFAILKAVGSKPELVTMDVLDLRKHSDHYVKLQQILERILRLIDQYLPDELAIEAPFYKANVQSMLKLGRAQGVAISAGLSRGLPIFEYAPRKVKLSITGNGNATKEQVALMLQKILNLESIPRHLDATDSLAVALCHYYQNRVATGNPSFKSWKDFIGQNPGKFSEGKPPAGIPPGKAYKTPGNLSTGK